MLSVGIVGLPNVGKSTLFNAITKGYNAEAANYPFCTIEPNVGTVTVPDDRLGELARLVHTEKIVPAAIELVDIAGLVKGASQGEGLGNKFLAHIRETHAIVQVVRCFEDSNITHTLDSVDPVRDIEVIQTELLLADLQSIQKQLDSWEKKAKSNDKVAKKTLELLKKLNTHLNAGQPARTLPLDPEETESIKTFCLLTQKPTLYVGNVAESDLQDLNANPHVRQLQAYIKDPNSLCFISGKLESDLQALAPDEAAQYLKELGVKSSGAQQLIQSAYRLLGLASYFTAGPKEVHAWTFKLGMKAPECAGIIHTDFQKGFIKAEILSYEDFIAYNGFLGARDKGKIRLEGKDYVFQEGDIAVFKFNKTQ